MGVLVVLSLILFSFFFFDFTGHASLDIKTNYVFGELIEGEFVLNLKAGEFVPADAEVVISYFDQTQRVLLSSLVSSEPITGEFYAEDTEISGEGFGYGTMGVSEISPELNFKLKIIRESESSSSAGSPSEESTGETESSESENNNQNPEGTESSPGITGAVIQEDFEVSGKV